MATASNTPGRPVAYSAADVFTPPAQTSLSRELKQVLHERNLLTAKSRRKVCSMLSDSITTETPSSCVRRASGIAGFRVGDAGKRMQFRRQAIQEILTSERSYIAQLDVLVKFFVRPLKDRTNLISTEQYQAIFGQVEMIYSLNLELLGELEADLDNVARAFKRIAPFFKLYSVYAFDYNRAQLILQELTERNVAFKKFLDANESRPEVQRQLISLLIAPIQRVPRYRLLLQQVVLYSSPSDADFRVLQESIREVESTVNHLNGVFLDQENMQALLDLQNSLVNRQPNIVQPSRKVIREGVLHKMSGSKGTKLRRYCVLMSDIFMYCKCLKERAPKQLLVGALECCCIFPLKKCRVSEIFPGTFKLTCQGDGIILSADTAVEGRSWLAAIKETIDVHVQCRRTIRKGSSKRAPIRRRDVKKFGANNDAGTTQTDPIAKRKYEFDTVLKCAPDSDTDLDNSVAAATCFGRANPNLIFKRKRPTSNVDRQSELQTPVQTPRAVAKKCNRLLSPTSPQTPPIRHWFQPGAGRSISALGHHSQMMLTSTPEQQPRANNAAADATEDFDFDPTYGMAAYAHHKSIGNVLPEDGNGSQLRFDHNATNNATNEENIENSGWPSAPKRKRVHFNIVESERDHGEIRTALRTQQSDNIVARPYDFASAKMSANNDAPSLRSRIAGFFASLF